MSDPVLQNSPKQKIISAKRSRRAAGLLNIGNIISMLFPFPLGILWLGLSMVVYVMNRHHPNPMVGNYTQAAAYRYYGLMGFVVVVATFFGTELRYWLITWAICALILIPWSILDLLKIHRDQWHDVYYEEGNYESQSVNKHE